MDNKTVLTELIAIAAKDYGIGPTSAEGLIRAVLAKLPGMPADEWLAGLEPLLDEFAHAVQDESFAWRNEVRGKIDAHARARIQPADSDAYQIERALSELVDKIVPGLDSGDLVADAKEASRHLDQRAPSEAGAVPLAYLWTHGTQKCLFYTHRRAQMHADSHGGGVTPLFAAPAAQPEKQAAQDGSMAAEDRMLFKRWPGGLDEIDAAIESRDYRIKQGRWPTEAAPPAPSQQAALGAEPLVGDAAQSLPERAAMIEAARHAGFQFWKMADGKYQLKPLVIGTAFAAPSAESAEPANPDKCNADVFTHGVSMGVFGMTKQQAEAYCKAETARTGRLHDWHYVAGRVHVKALIAQPTAATADAQGNIAASVSDKSGCLSHSAGSDKQADAQGDERAAPCVVLLNELSNGGKYVSIDLEADGVLIYGIANGDTVKTGQWDIRESIFPPPELSTALARQPSAPASAELTPAARDVLAERQRQISVEGWHAAEDDNHEDGQMAAAAACYAMFTQAYPPGDPVQYWPWDKSWWKPSTPRRNLVKAGALILAEIERLDRAALAAARPEGGNRE